MAHQGLVINNLKQVAHEDSLGSDVLVGGGAGNTRVIVVYASK